MAEIMHSGRSSFVGVTAGEIAKATNFTVADGSPGIEDYSDLFCLPRIDALYREDGSIVPSSRLVHFDEAMTPAGGFESASRKYEKFFPASRPIPKTFAIEERPVVFMGSTTPHWGHFLFEGLSRMWPLVTGDVDAGGDLLLFTRRWPQPAFADEMLAALGIDPARVLCPSVPTLYRRVRVVRPSVNYSFRIFHAYSDVHRRIAARLSSARRFDRPVFISRAGLENRMHDFLGEDVLEREFVVRGFDAVRPETLSVADQIALFSTCPVIVGSIGSAFHGILFEPAEGDRVRVMFSPANPGRRFAMVDAINGGHRSWYLNVMPKITERNQQTVIDTDQALAYVRELPI